MACKSGPLRLGYKSTLFPTIFIDERSRKMAGINVEILGSLAQMEKCGGLEFTEYSSEESFCTEQRCVNALSQAVLNASAFADVDSLQLTSADVSLYRYSVPVDVPRLVMLEGRPIVVKQLAMDMRFYTIYNIDSAVLLILLLIFRTVLKVLRSRLAIYSREKHRFMRALCGLFDFVSRLLHVISIFLIVVFYQCYFNGNVLGENVQKDEFGSVIEDLLNGTRRMLIDTGVLMENEYHAFGPLTTVMNDEGERLERLCNDGDDIVLLWDDQLFGLANFNPNLVRNCKINRIDIPIDTNNHPIPRLEKSMLDGQPLHFVMPRSTPRKTVKRINHILTTIFTHDLRNSLHVRRYIPARTQGAAFDAYRATFPSGAQFPAFLDRDTAVQAIAMASHLPFASALSPHRSVRRLLCFDSCVSRGILCQTSSTTTRYGQTEKEPTSNISSVNSKSL